MVQPFVSCFGILLLWLGPAGRGGVGPRTAGWWRGVGGPGSAVVPLLPGTLPALLPPLQGDYIFLLKPRTTCGSNLWRYYHQALTKLYLEHLKPPDYPDTHFI